MSPTNNLFVFLFILATILVPPPQALGQEQSSSVDEITVIGSSPLSGEAIDANLPAHIQVFTAEELQKDQFLSLADFLDRNAGGVSINHAQNNPLQPDVQVRGFTASPLLGAPQGVAVYLNGVRINEPFGDTVNWDLLDASFVDRLALVSGANAAYGLNALGGSLLVNSKTAFSSPGTTISASAGSFQRREATASHGANDGTWGYFVGLDAFEEESWRDFSNSTAYNGYASLGLREEAVEWDTFAFVADTELRGNGAAPEQLLALDRSAVFTHPDLTENRLAMLSSQLALQLDETSSLRSNIFFRRNTTDAFNGDGSEFDECDAPISGLLCEEDDEEPVEDQFGQPVGENFDGINNISEREQTSWGASAEYYRRWQLSGTAHHSSIGVDVYSGETEFSSQVEFAQLTPERSTTRSGRFDSEGATTLDSRSESAALYWIDRFAAGERSDVTLSLRYNVNRVKTTDPSGLSPALEGDHSFSGLNGGIGLNYQLAEDTRLYASLHQSSRSPTPVELACSHPEAPCTLPNTFLADPPLDEVIAHNLELGLRHWSSTDTLWQTSTFISRIRDDIVFQSTGGVSSNEGFFSNASDTRRVGLSAQLESGSEGLRWALRYNWLLATFEDDFLVSSPNHPFAVDDRIPVVTGDRLPGLPEHSLSLSADWQVANQLFWRWDAHYQSGLYLRGDEGNLDAKTDNFARLNTTLSYEPAPALEVFLTINNVLDKEYESFGLYGEPDEVLPQLDSGNNRFLSPGEPRGAWLGARYHW